MSVLAAGITGEQNFANVWRGNYSDIVNCVQSILSQNQALRSVGTNSVDNVAKVVTIAEFIMIVSRLKGNIKHLQMMKFQLKFTNFHHIVYL